MGRKDLVTFRYFEDRACYADLINGFTFGGRQVVKPKDVEEWNPHVTGSDMRGALPDRAGKKAKNRQAGWQEVDAIEHMFLELYLALVLMTIDITKLAPVAGQMGIILLMQAVIMALFAIFISYNMFGRDYGAAVMAAGNCGWGCGSGPNAVANEKAVMDQYGWHNVAWVLYPSFAVLIDDIYNPIFLSIFGSLVA